MEVFLACRMQAQLGRVLQEVQWLGLRLDPKTEVDLSLHVAQSPKHPRAACFAAHTDTHITCIPSVI